MSAIELFAEIIQELMSEDIWGGSPLAGYRALGMTNRGEAGEEFVRRYLRNHGIDVSNGSRTSRVDLRVAECPVEVKTASLGSNGTFQFNHLRLDRDYAFLLCVGVCPDEIRFGIWPKAAVVEGDAGTLVRMAEAQQVTYKLTKKRDDLRTIEELPEEIRKVT